MFYMLYLSMKLTDALSPLLHMRESGTENNVFPESRKIRRDEALGVHSA